MEIQQIILSVQPPYHVGVLIGVDASRVTRPRRTGTENYSLEVLRALLRLDRQNTYRLYLSQPLPPRLLPSPVGVQTRLIRLPRLWTQVGLTGEMITRPPDVLFVPSHVLPLVHPPASVVVIYDVGHRFFPEAHHRAERVYAEFTIRRHVRRAAVLLTISESSKADIVRLYGADPRRVRVAYPAAGPEFSRRPADEVVRTRERYGLPTRYLLHVGTVKPRKNLPRLVRAFAAASLPPDVVLAIAGQVTWGGPELAAAIREAHLGDRLRVLPYVPQEDLPALYSGARGVAVVSLHEGFGMPALEALACGAPVVVSDRGSLPEVVADSGLLVNPLDTASIARGLERAVLDDRLAMDLRVRGPIRASAFTWTGAAGVTLAALEEAARLGPPRPAGRRPQPHPRSDPS